MEVNAFTVEEVVANTAGELTAALKNGARAIRVAWTLVEGDLKRLADALTFNVTLERLSFSSALPASIGELVSVLRRNVTLSRIDLADGDPHKAALDLALSPATEVVEPLIALVPRLGLVTSMLGDKKFNYRALRRALADVLSRDHGPDVVLTALVALITASEGAAWNNELVSFLIDDASVVPKPIKTAISATATRIAEGWEDPEGCVVYTNLARAVFSQGGVAPRSAGLLACKLGLVKVLTEEPLGAWGVDVAVGDLGNTPLLMSSRGGHSCQDTTL